MAKPSTWSNWSGSATARPAARVTAHCEQDVVNIVRRAAREGRTVRPIGAGHSFTPVAATDGYLLSLDGLTGIASTTPLPNGNTLVALRAGTRLRDLPKLLGPRGLAVPNQGDVDPQSLAGALSTGTHGTGLGFTGFGGLVRALRLVDATGTLHECSPEKNSELFNFARVGLGVFGILTEITLECVPRFCLQAQERPLPLSEVLNNWSQLCHEADHFEFYFFPYTELALTKTNTRLPWGNAKPPHPVKEFIDDEIINNAGLELLCRIGHRIPQIVPSLNNFSAKAVATRTYTDDAHKVFVSPRRVRFNEMEYAIAFEDLPDVFREIKTRIESSGMPIEFPLEVRCAAADNVPLSTAYQRKSAYIAVHRYWREDYREYFKLVEPVLKAAQGRPHWGKIHTLSHDELAAVHPTLTQACSYRASADPNGVFLNPMTSAIFGVTT